MHPSKGIKNGFHPVGGRFVSPDGSNRLSFGQTPEEWKKGHVTKPTGTYTFHTYNNGFDSEPESSDLAIKYTFNPNGTLSASFIKEYTEYAPQELAGETTTKKKTARGTKYKSTRQLTGGWYYDITAKATYNGKWTLKNDTLTARFTGKPVITVSAKFNRQRQIDKWKEEDAARYFEFKMDTYRRQYLAQAQADFPNYCVDEEKDKVKEYLKSQFGELTGFTYLVREMDANDIALTNLAGKSRNIMSFQKKPRWTTWYDGDELVAGIKALYNNWDEVSKIIIKTRNEKIISQLNNATDLGPSYNMYLGNMSDDGESASLLVIKNVDGKWTPYGYKVNFKEDKVIPDYDSAFVYTALEDLTAEMNNNEKILLALSESKDKKDKDAKKAAKKHIKLTSKSPVSTSFSDLESYFNALREVKSRIVLQRNYLP